MDYLESTLKEALAASATRDLPKRYDENSGEIWIKGIALVRKLNGTKNYALATKNGSGVIKVVQDFGVLSPIVGVADVFPYLYLDKKRFIDNLTTREEKIAFLGRVRGSLNYSKYTEEQIEAMVIDAAIKRQEENDALDVVLNEIAEANLDFSDGREKVTTTRVVNDDLEVEDIESVRDLNTDKKEKRKYTRRNIRRK